MNSTARDLILQKRFAEAADIVRSALSKDLSEPEKSELVCTLIQLLWEQSKGDSVASVVRGVYGNDSVSWPEDVCLVCAHLWASLRQYNDIKDLIDQRLLSDGTTGALEGKSLQLMELFAAQAAPALYGIDKALQFISSDASRLPNESRKALLARLKPTRPMLPDSVFNGGGADMAITRTSGPSFWSSLISYLRTLLRSTWFQYGMIGFVAIVSGIVIGSMVRRRISSRPSGHSAPTRTSAPRRPPPSASSSTTRPPPMQQRSFPQSSSRSRGPPQSMAQQTSRARRILGQVTEVARSAVSVTHAANADRGNLM